MICRRCRHVFPSECELCLNCGRGHSGSKAERWFKLAAILFACIALVLAVYLGKAMR